PINEKGEPIKEKQALAALNKSQLKFNIKGKKIKGEFVLVHLKGDDKNHNSWLLIKHRDEYAVDEPYNSEDFVPASVKRAGEKKKEERVTRPRANIRFPASSQKFTDYFNPMLATLVEEPFDDKEWIFEIKWDGYRAVADWQHKKLKFYSRNGLSFKEKFAVVAHAIQKIKHDVVLDGEVVLMNEENKPDFQKLQHYEDNLHLPLIYYAFDLLFLDGENVMELPLLERKKLLQKLLAKNNDPVIRYSDHIEETGKAFFKKAQENNLEGIIAKKADCRYVLGIRSREWLKIKHKHSREAIIAGYTEPRGGRKHFGALILGQYDKDELRYMGHTGTGFDQKSLKELWGKMQLLITEKSPFKEKIKVNMPVTWIKPKLVCQVHYTEVTEGGLLRHPVYLGLRTDKNFKDVQKINEESVSVVDKKPGAVSRKKQAKKSLSKKSSTESEENSSTDNTISIEGKKVAVSNLNKIWWPKEKITKGDLINYYEKIAPYIIPYLKDRALSLKRNPNGILDEGFFHKDAGAQAPSWVKKVDVHSESNDKIIHYIMCNDKASLIYVSNLGCIEMNPWNSTTKKMEYPTWMVIDIDPSDKNTFDEVVETAQAVKMVLDKAGADGYCKTSGASGLHVYVPMGAKYNYDQVKEFGEIVATMVQEQLPGTTSIVRSLNKRGNKIYVDFLQNRRGQTLAAAYSVRPKPGAT
ncbi:MAG: DNA ligase D, partial [Bacteroidota bacterium]|nr:DNA ligase D [Bacteroidota bacterium]